MYRNTILSGLRQVRRVGFSRIHARQFCIRYTETHEWARKLDDSRVQVGITDFAKGELGEIVFVDFQSEAGESVNKGDELCAIESVKAVGILYAPISGKLLKSNNVDDIASKVDGEPQKGGWLWEIEVKDWEEFQAMKSEEEYKSLL